MASLGLPSTGPFRGALAFDEGAAGVFFGRRHELEALQAQVLREATPVTALTGASGVGKTSLLRAGLIPALARAGMQPLYLGQYGDLAQELLQAASRVRAEPAGSGESEGDYLLRLARGSRAGTVVICDHLEQLLAPTAEPNGAPEPVDARLQRLAALLGPALAAGSRLRVLLCIEASEFARLDRLAQLAPALAPGAGAWLAIERLDATAVAEIIEQTALATGTFIEAGLPRVVAADLCRGGRALPLDLQLLGKRLTDQRILTVRRYEKSGGASLLLPSFFAAIVREAGGHDGLRVLLDVLETAPASIDEIGQRTGLPRAKVEPALTTFVARGLLAKQEAERTERFVLLHPALAPRIAQYGAEAQAATASVRRRLRKRVYAGERLTIPELVLVRRRLGAALNADEASAVRRSTRRAVFQVSLVALVTAAVLVVLYLDARASYTLKLLPDADRPGARVVVTMGRPDRGWLQWLPASPPFGAPLADTGFAAVGLSDELATRIRRGHAMGKRERAGSTAVPAWLRTVLAGARPVPRGVATVLLGEPSGIVSLKQAFTEPGSRREVLDALAVIGRGRAGEDEILAAALADPSAEIRRRGVEVAAAIDRRLGSGSHAATLRSALGDRSPEVRQAVLREARTLAAGEQASILAVALADQDPSFRHLAEKATLELAEKDPAAAAEAARAVAKHADTLLRRSGLGLLETVVAHASGAEAARTLAALVADEHAPEETRVTALLMLRRAGAPPPELTPVIEKAVAPDASPRLRAAALPLYARLVPPERAQELAATESHGSAPARAAGAAVWGIVAAQNPEAAAKALRGLSYDSAVEVRTEAARAYGSLRREGPGLVQRALLDPSPDVQRAALEAAGTLGVTNPTAVVEMLSKALKAVRVSLRRSVVEALGKIGESKPALVAPQMARALKENDPAIKEAAAATLCQVARRSPSAAAPYLRVAARDSAREVRIAVAGCLDALGGAEPKAAVRIVAELGTAPEAPVRIAAAQAGAALALKAREMVLPALLALLADPDHGVRMAALSGLDQAGGTGISLGRWAADLERALGVALGKGDREERRLVVEVAARYQLLPLLRLAASDGDEALRRTAVHAAGTMQPPALEILRSAADDASAAVRAEATRLLVAATGAGGQNVLPVFEAMLQAADVETRATGARALGELAGSEETAARALSGALGQRSESVRVAAAEALGKIASRRPAVATPQLESALADPAHDVRTAASRGLAMAWAQGQRVEDLVRTLKASEADSVRRLVAVEALLAKAATDASARAQVSNALADVGRGGPPLARLYAEAAAAFVGQPAPPGGGFAGFAAFIDRLLGL